MNQIGITPPSEPEFEKSVLNVLMSHRDSFEKVASILERKHFHNGANAEIYSAIVKVCKHGAFPDFGLVKKQLEEDRRLDSAGGLMYLLELVGAVKPAINLEVHAKKIVEAYLRRQAIELGLRIINLGHDPSVDLSDIAVKTREWSYNLEITGKSRRKTLAEVANEALLKYTIPAWEGKNSDAFPIPLPGFDEYALIPGDVWVIAGRPGMGKTSVMMHIAIKASKAGIPVIANMLDQSDEAIALRQVASAHGKVGFSMYTGRGLTGDDIQDFGAYVDKNLQGIYPCFCPSIEAFKSEVASFRRDMKIPIEVPIIAMVDFLQLMSAGGSSTTENVTKVSKALKEMSKPSVLNLYMIEMSQLSRAVESRGGDKKPMMSDLRDSGSIEQDADMITFLYRPEYYGFTQLEDGSSTSGLLIYTNSKTRMGRAGDEISGTFQNGMVVDTTVYVPTINVPLVKPPVRDITEASREGGFDFPFG